MLRCGSGGRIKYQTRTSATAWRNFMFAIHKGDPETFHSRPALTTYSVRLGYSAPWADGYADVKFSRTPALFQRLVQLRLGKGRPFGLQGEL